SSRGVGHRARFRYGFIAVAPGAGMPCCRSRAHCADAGRGYHADSQGPEHQRALQLIPHPQFIELDEVESTMTEAADRLAREEIGPWTTIIARHQTQGRGRRDRRWEAASGDALLATVVVPLEIPPERIGLIALATGLAIADAISEWTVPVSLKWPN